MNEKLSRLLERLGFRGRIVAGVLAVIAVPTVIVGLTTFIAMKVTALPDGVALRVDETDVTKAEVAKHTNVLTLLYGIQPPEDPAAFDRFRRDAAQAVALDRVLERAAVEMGIGISDKVAADTLNQIVVKGGSLGPQRFPAVLAQSGVDQQDLLQEVKRQSLSQQLYTRVIDQSGAQQPVTDDEVRRFYDEHRAEMVRVETRHLRNILVAEESDADQLLAEAKGGADFAELARRSSIDTSTKAKGGDLGFLNRYVLEDDYAAAAFGVPPNSFFGPVKGASGWNVGQVLEVTPEVPLALPDLAEQLRSDIQQDKIQAAWQGWAEQRFKAAHVEYADDYRPENPEDLAVPRIPQAPPNPSPGG